jgi:FMN-dependent NADH-azoreductase
MKLLEIQSSPRGESSDSITLIKSFIEACKSDNTSIVVDRLNVWHERLPEFEYEAIGGSLAGTRIRPRDRSPGNLFWTFGCSL